MPTIGSVAVCAETRKQFTIAKDGCSYNYAKNKDGEIFSDQGVHIRECKELLNRSKPFSCYTGDDGKIYGE